MKENSKKGILLLGEGAPKNSDLVTVTKYYTEYFNDPKVSVNDTWFKAFKRNKLFLPELVHDRKTQLETIKFQDGVATHIISEKIRNNLELNVNAPIFLANRYGKPSITDVLKDVDKKGIEKLLIIPLFPNYLPVTYDTAVLKTFEIAENLFPNIDLHLVAPFYNHKDYIKPMEIMIRNQNIKKRINHLLFVYKGLKEEHLPFNNCDFKDSISITEKEKQTNYCYQIKTTTNMILEKVKSLKFDYSISLLPSKLGSGKYTDPITEDVLEGLIAIGKKNITVISPSTIVDNIETLYDINIELREKFMKMGGESFTLIPSINDHPEWIEHLEKWSNEWLLS